MCAGLWKFKNEGEDMFQQDLKQLHDMDMFKPVLASNHALEQKKKALLTVSFIKQEWDNQVKGRVCTDRRK